ncbi:uncharacterized protein LOC120182710 [Hibiscus syriacus]|uniref:uncharacterized protein LOC120182710 n=1 Tax=Hibiscus syriacus TaxID=106335 RepID=UPI001921F4C5|nr:uncharacterized protein LOC120182710 [Hibiscus syriacus]
MEDTRIIHITEDIVGSHKVQCKAHMYNDLLDTRPQTFRFGCHMLLCEVVGGKNPRVPVSVLLASIRNTFGYIPTYYKAWMAKWEAMTSLYGDWDHSYNELPRLLQAMKFFILGTIVRYYTHPAVTLEGDVIPGKRIFCGLFWAFKPTIQGVRFYKQMIKVDCTFLYELYRHVLMIVIAQDGDKNIFPITFVIVKNE